MNDFPGSIYDGEGRSLSTGFYDLTQEQINDHTHRSMVAREPPAPIAEIWLLKDGASFAAISTSRRSYAVSQLQAGRSIILLSRHPEPGADVRDELLAALDLAERLRDEASDA